MSEKTERKYYPAAVVWEITFACNMRCLHCGTAAGKIRSDELTTQEALNLIDELTDLGSERITLSGGEPLLRKDWALLARRVNERGAHAYLITNGYAVDEAIIAQFEELGFKNIGVSFDGTEKTHNYIRQRDESYRRAVKAMSMMAKSGKINFCAVSQISNMNLGELDQIKRILEDIGVPKWRIQMTTSTGRMREHSEMVLTLDRFPQFIDKLLAYKQSNGIAIDVGENIGFYGCKGTKLWDDKPYMGCFAGLRVAGITSNGDVRGCLSLPEEFKEGNIRDSSFAAIWNNPQGFAYNRQFSNLTAEGFCRTCKYQPLCRGGCATTSYAASGTRANNPYCIYQVELQEGIDGPDNDLVADLLEHVNRKLKAEARPIESQ